MGFIDDKGPQALEEKVILAAEEAPVDLVQGGQSKASLAERGAIVLVAFHQRLTLGTVPHRPRNTQFAEG